MAAPVLTASAAMSIAQASLPGGQQAGVLAVLGIFRCGYPRVTPDPVMAYHGRQLPGARDQLYARARIVVALAQPILCPCWRARSSSMAAALDLSPMKARISAGATWVTRLHGFRSPRPPTLVSR